MLTILMILAWFAAGQNSDLDRAREDYERVQSLVANGTLARIKLDEAAQALAEAEDRDALAHTLYSPEPLEKMTEGMAEQMIAAATRRTARQEKTVQHERELLGMGIVARSEVEAAEAELASRQRELEMTQTRQRLLKDLRAMAENERLAEQQNQLRTLELRFDGNGVFRPQDLKAVEDAFQEHFRRPLPVSAQGQTAVHQALGLDHRGRVDVALAPDSGEGVWLRQLLERRRIPYLAFRSALAGAATAPHIHLGTGSPRLQTRLGPAAR